MVIYLCDKSALARVVRSPEVGERLADLAMNGRLATCAIVDLEIGFSARSVAELDAVAAERRALYVELEVNHAVTRRALEVQRELARRGKHRGPGASDLLIAACAEVHGAVVVHYDKDFDTIAAVTKQEVQWIAPQGSVD